MLHFNLNSKRPNTIVPNLTLDSGEPFCHFIRSPFIYTLELEQLIFLKHREITKLNKYILTLELMLFLLANCFMNLKNYF